MPDGSLVISVVAVEFGGEPLRDRVTGVIDGGAKVIRFRDQDVGAKFQVGKYVVRIVDVDTFSATFSVRTKGPFGG
jgi:hypothetical protein